MPKLLTMWICGALLTVAASCATVESQPQGIDVRFVVSVRAPAVRGGTDLRTYENGVLMRVGNNFERDLDGQFRVRLRPVVRGDKALVEYEFRDLKHHGILVGSGTAEIGIGSAKDITFGEIEGRRYSVHFTVHRRELPKSV